MTWWDPASDLTFGVGETPPATKWNKIRDDLDWLHSGTPFCRMRLVSGSQSFGSGVWTALEYDNVVVGGGMTTDGISVITVPIDGVYLAVLNEYGAGGSAGSVIETRLQFGGGIAGHQTTYEGPNVSMAAEDTVSAGVTIQAAMIATFSVTRVSASGFPRLTVMWIRDA